MEITWYAVYLCGPTDCFIHAIFAEEKRAKEWGIENSKHCDGYLIKKLTGEQTAKLAVLGDEYYPG